MEQHRSRASFNFEDLSSFIDFTSFRFLLTALSSNKIAIATSRYLIIVEDNARLDQDDERLQTVVEFGEVSGRPTAITWISPETVCVGFESGGLSCFNPYGDTMAEIEFSNSPVAAIHTYPSADPKVAEQEVWALYENKYIVSIPLSHLLGATGTLSRYYLKFKLMDQVEVQDFVVLPEPYCMSIFDADINSPNNSFIVVGLEPSLSLYNIGGKQHFQHLGKLASYVRERVGSAISKTVSNALVSFFGSGGGASEPKGEEDYTPITSSLDFIESNKRRIVRVSLDPTGKLLAAADTLGRVLLFDMRFVSTVLRVWKGVREARFAWTMDLTPAPTSSTLGDAAAAAEGAGGSSPRRYQLSLAIYAPQLGLLSLYQARHGPCLRSIPVGPQCQIFTLQEAVASGEILHRCALLRPSSPADSPSPLLHLSIVSPFDHADDDIDLNELQAKTQAEAEAIEQSREEEDQCGMLMGGRSAGGEIKLADLLPPSAGLVNLFPPPLLHLTDSNDFVSGGVPTAVSESNVSVREECLRFLHKLEKLLKESLLLTSTQAQTPPSVASSKTGQSGCDGGREEEGGGGSAENSLASIEHRLWMLLSSSSAHNIFLSSLSDTSYDGEGVSLLLHCVSLIERAEVDMYTRQAFMEHAHTSTTSSAGSGGSTHNHNGNSKECGMYFFSLQFHRNICRLLDDVGVSALSLSRSQNTEGSSCTMPGVLVQYAQSRSKLVKAYTMLMDINTHLSLSEMTVLAARSASSSFGSDGEATSKDSSDSGFRKSPKDSAAPRSVSPGVASGGGLREEAASWAGRFLRAHLKSPLTPSGMDSSASGRPGITGEYRQIVCWVWQKDYGFFLLGLFVDSFQSFPAPYFFRPNSVSAKSPELISSFPPGPRECGACEGRQQRVCSFIFSSSPGAQRGV